MNFQRLEDQICEDEGFRSEPYVCPAGVATQGYGTTRILTEPVTMDNPPISEQTARELMRSDLYRACIDAQELFERFDEMDAERQEVLVNMCYNLGRRGLSRFKRLRKAAEALDYRMMAWEMRDSRWFRQVGQRAERLYQTMYGKPKYKVDQ